MNKMMMDKCYAIDLLHASSLNQENQPPSLLMDGVVKASCLRREGDLSSCAVKMGDGGCKESE